MKKKIVVFALTAFLATSIAVAVNSFNNQSITQTDAEAYNDRVTVLNGLFEKVTDINTIQDEEELLVLAENKYTFQYSIGASYHYWMTTEFSEFNDVFNNGNIVYANNVKGELVTFDKNDDGSYYLKLDHWVDYAVDRGSIKSAYIVHEAYDNRGVTAFGDLFFRENKNKPSANASKWRVTKENGHTTITSLSGRQLHWKECGGYSWSSFIATEHTDWDSNIELYRRVTDTFGTAFTIDTPATKQTYAIGDEADLKGLSVTLTLPSGLTMSASYDDKPHLFSNIEFLSYYRAVFFDFCGIRGYIPVTMDDGLSNEHLYLRSDTKIVDPRGTYLLGVTGGLTDKHFSSTLEDLPNTFILNLLTRNVDPSHSTDYKFGEVVPIFHMYFPTYTTNPVSDLRMILPSANPVEYEEYTDVSENRIKIVLEDGNYYLKGAMQNNYLYSNAGELTSSPNTPPGTQNSISIDENNHILTHNGANIYVVDTTDDDNTVKTVSINSLPNENYRPLELFKLQFTSSLNDQVTALNNFKALFYEKTTNYKSGVSAENWAALKTAFNGLGFELQSSYANDSQGFLASVQYNHNQEKANSFEEMLDIYDYIVFVNDGNLEDFMSRGVSGALFNYRNVTLNGEHCVINGNDRAYHNSSYVATFDIDTETTSFPEDVEVLMDGNILSKGTHYTYNHADNQGTITINSGVVTEDVVINVVCDAHAYRVTYKTPASDATVSEIIELDPGTYTLKTYEQSGLPALPDGKEFKCWLVDYEELNPETVITLTGDTVITAVFKNIEAIDELNYRETVSSLSYDYEATGDNEFEFTNVALRFGGLISKRSWDQLDETFRENEQSHGILGFGVLFTTNSLDDLEQLTPQNATYDCYVDVATMEHPNTANESMKSANGISVLSDVYYSWNLRVNVSEKSYKTDVTAVAYIKTATNGYMYFGQVTTSVKKQATEMLFNRNYDEKDYDGSLLYLASL